MLTVSGALWSAAKTRQRTAASFRAFALFSFMSGELEPDWWFGVRTSFGAELLRPYSLEILTASVLLAFNSSSVTSIARLTFV